MMERELQRIRVVEVLLLPKIVLRAKSFLKIGCQRNHWSPNFPTLTFTYSRKLQADSHGVDGGRFHGTFPGPHVCNSSIEISKTTAV